jgi:hypothetical protein
VRGFTGSLPPYGIWIVLASVVVILLVWFLVAGRRRRAASLPGLATPRQAPAARTATGPWESVADRAVESARRRLVGQRYAGLTISSVLHYGAVDLGTEHLVVWVLVSGERSEDLPGWWSPEEITDHPLPSGWAGWLTSVRDVVREELARESWPDASSSSVLVDSEERVRRVGFDYFR